MIQQISLAATTNPLTPSHPDRTDPKTRLAERKAFLSSLDISSRRAPYSLSSTFPLSPHPLLVSRLQLDNLRKFHHALDLAVTNIVERWWVDHEAALPRRMPLEEREEEVLQWIHKTSEEKKMRPFHIRKGIWRPDLLIENVPTPSGQRQELRVCDINARCAFDLFPFVVYGHQGLTDIGAKERGFFPATNSREMLQRLFTVYDPRQQIHLLTGKDRAVSMRILGHLMSKRLDRNLKPTVITSKDLRLIPSPHSKTGYILCCLRKRFGSNPCRLVNEHGEHLEPIHQLGMQLDQEELRALSQDMLQHISLYCINDLRTVYLVQDKRMLGIILQELDDLVHRHHVLTSAQADLLRTNILPTIIPGSSELDQLIFQSHENKTIKNDYVLKPIRAGRPKDIIFGEDLTPEQWEATLLSMENPQLRAEEKLFIVQRRVDQPTLDILLDEEKGTQKTHVTGSYHAIDGGFAGFGVWRTGEGRICSFDHGASWIPSVVPFPQRRGSV
ncbi:hypothetical protein ASPWEDRAFT_101498 [Aspergillus wentii DTO 134E9]|uniref:Glutathionylspermidine synthase pre-ATP-grasp-like domain-containing protein n=1 Tax=Aspergillus wentii DTO 134E9 TaxID=1073089 RepID=A0A1L9S189_ASPWE|nr:uncharacterized protein ASPWEDRAFT_101498 [Aspergillus wentii DTO 134E9]OJJ40921.1 hypothetical protein ASPWEDRAFT_101498 [Aspergillus wentii DTO 134E9]